jgi:hypothetical protein
MHARLALAVALALGLVTVARADVKPLDKAKVPAAVKKAADDYATSLMKLETRGFEEETDDKGKLVGYRAVVGGMLNNGHEEIIELEISAAGKIVRENVVVETKDVPAAVTASLAASKLAKGKIVRAKKLAAKLGDKATGWELEVEENGKTSLARFDAAGKLVRTQERVAAEKKG